MEQVQFCMAGWHIYKDACLCIQERKGGPKGKVSFLNSITKLIMFPNSHCPRPKFALTLSVVPCSLSLFSLQLSNREQKGQADYMIF